MPFCCCLLCFPLLCCSSRWSCERGFSIGVRLHLPQGIPYDATPPLPQVTWHKLPQRNNPVWSFSSLSVFVGPVQCPNLKQQILRQCYQTITLWGALLSIIWKSNQDKNILPAGPLDYCCFCQSAKLYTFRCILKLEDVLTAAVSAWVFKWSQSIFSHMSKLCFFSPVSLINGSWLLIPQPQSSSRKSADVMLEYPISFKD